MTAPVPIKNHLTSPCRTEPSTHDTTFFWADECRCAGEVLTTDGAYTKHKPIFGPLSGAS